MGTDVFQGQDGSARLTDEGTTSIVRSMGPCSQQPLPRLGRLLIDREVLHEAGSKPNYRQAHHFLLGSVHTYDETFADIHTESLLGFADG